MTPLVTEQKQENIRGELNSIADRLSRKKAQVKISDIYIDDTFSQRQDYIQGDKEITDIKKVDDSNRDDSSLPDLIDHEGKVVFGRRQQKRSIEHIN